MEEPIMTAISSVGFPIVITFYLLTRFEKSMDRLTCEISTLIQELRPKTA